MDLESKNRARDIRHNARRMMKPLRVGACSCSNMIFRAGTIRASKSRAVGVKRECKRMIKKEGLDFSVEINESVHTKGWWVTIWKT